MTTETERKALADEIAGLFVQSGNLPPTYFSLGMWFTRNGPRILAALRAPELIGDQRPLPSEKQIADALSRVQLFSRINDLLSPPQIEICRYGDEDAGEAEIVVLSSHDTKFNETSLLNKVVRDTQARAVLALLSSPPPPSDTGEGWHSIETAPPDEKVMFCLDWADDCSALNYPLGDRARLFFGMRGQWSSVYKATHWRRFAPPSLAGG